MHTMLEGHPRGLNQDGQEGEAEKASKGSVQAKRMKRNLQGRERSMCRDWEPR